MEHAGMIRRALAATLLAAVIIAAVVPGVAVAETISGNVYGSGPPIAGARVEATLDTFEGPELSGHSFSDGGGNYSIAGLSAGTYWLRAIRPGYLNTQSGPFPTVGPVTTRGVDMTPDPVLTERLSDNDRYSTAVRVARERYTLPSAPTDWRGVMYVVIASGEDRAAADPLAAAGLCGAYDAPLFLVNSRGASGHVKSAIAEMADGTPYGYSLIRVIIVGGPVSVPDSVFDDLKTYVEANTSGGTLAKDRIVATGDRYDLAAEIARRMKTRTGGSPAWALVANGADAEKFFDPLALSTVAASKDYPILLVSETSVPSATRDALTDLGNPDVVVGGGPATVSNSVVGTLDTQVGTVERWWGNDRYLTAVAVADEAIGKGWLTDDLVGLSAKLPDALSGGAMIGQLRGTLLVTDGQSLTPAAGNWLSTHKAGVDKCYIIGGPVSVSTGVMAEANSKLQ
jgi:putative cell wall-binding protein